MKSLSGVNRVFGTSRRRENPPTDNSPETTLATPEANALRSVKLFCESGGPGHAQGDEILHLPAIVEAAESSPVAAKECAYQIRKTFSKDNSNRPYVQYNGVMLMRILADNPGATFTKNIDKKYVDSVKELSRTCRDPGVQQILTDTLNNFEKDKAADVNLAPLIEMWKKEKTKIAKVLAQGGQAGHGNSPWIGHHPRQFSPHTHFNNGLPSPEELASRIEEAQNSATLLTQLVQSTPHSELLQNDLIREFANRCQSASRSIQAYMAAEHPAPDNDTMLTLIEANEKLSLAATKHQRAVLQARKSLGFSNTPNQQPSPSVSPANTSSFAPPPERPRSNPKHPAPPSRKSFPNPTQPVVSRASSFPTPTQPMAPRASTLPNLPAAENPFTDPVESSHGPMNTVQDHSEPYHPGFSSAIGQTEHKYITTESAIHSTAPSALKQERNQPQDLYSDDDDPYSAPTERKAPVYRY